MTTPLVSVVIVGYNSGHILRKCLEKIGSDSRLELVLVDNDSSDDTIDVFLDAAPGGKVIRRESNGGFAVAVNEGVRVCSGKNVLLLNPDAGIEAGQIVRLSSHLLDPNVGIVAPVVKSNSSLYPTVTAGRFPSVYRMFLHESGLARLGALTPLLEGHYLFARNLRSGMRDVDWVTGGCLLTSRATWDMLGGLSEKWFMYAEDIEFCWRSSEKGLKCVLSLDEEIEHAIGGSSKGIDGRLNTAWIVNLFDFYRSSMAPSRLAVSFWRAEVLVGFALRALLYSFKFAGRVGDRDVARWNMRRYLVYMRALAKA